MSECSEEISFVEVTLKDSKIRVINFYGPQEPQNDQDKNLVRKDLSCLVLLGALCQEMELLASHRGCHRSL